MENETQNLLEYENRQLRAVLEKHGIKYELDPGVTLPNDCLMTHGEVTERTLAILRGHFDGQDHPKPFPPITLKRPMRFKSS